MAARRRARSGRAPGPVSGEDRDWQRLDKWLWCARLLRQRADCAALAAAGGIRVNRLPTDKPHAKLRVGDVITVPLRGDVRVLRVLALAARRGPAPEAAGLYQDILEPVAEVSPAGTSSAGQPCADPHSRSYPASEAQGLAGEF